MSRSIWIYAGLLVALLALAWFRYTGVLGAGEQDETDEVVVLRIEQDDIERVAFHNEKLDVTIELREDALGSYAWVSLEERKKKPLPKLQPTEEEEGEAAEGGPAEGDAAEGDAAEGDAAEGDEAGDTVEDEPEFEIEVVSSQFKGGDATDKVVESLAPLLAVRSLGEVAADKLADLELEIPESWLEVTHRGKQRRIDVGGESYGTRDFYVHDPEAGAYYIVDSDTFRPLKYAKSRLPDRRLTALEAQDLERVVLSAASGSVEMIHQNRQDKDAAYWAGTQDLERPVELYANWLDKALRLKGLNYVQADEQPQALQPAFKLALYAEGAEPINIEVLEELDPEGGDSAWFARSEFTRGLMKLHKVLASEATEDVADVIEARPDDEDYEDEGFGVLDE